MAWSDEFDEEDAAAAAAAAANIGNASNEVNPSNTGFMSMLSQGIEKMVNASMLGQASKLLNKIAPSTWSNMTNKERWMAGGAQAFFKNEDGTWNVSNPFKIDPTTGQEATRKHRMVTIFGKEYPMGPPVQVDDTTPFMLEHFSRGEINPEMLAEKRRLWDLWLLTGRQQYLDQYNNAESNPKWA